MYTRTRPTGRYQRDIPTTSTTVQGRSVLSFKEAIARAEDQIEVKCLPRHLGANARDICRVIAEVYMLPDESQIKIEGEMLPAAMVRQIFLELTSEHVQYVIDEIMHYEGAIFAMKPFIRTLLYNAVMTMDVAITHDMRDDI